MKKITKIIDGDKVTIYEGRQVDLNDDLPSEIDLSKSEWKVYNFTIIFSNSKN
jgi:hypothetical protein